VEQFLAGKIKFGNIVELVRRCLDNHIVKMDDHRQDARDTNASLEELLEADAWAKKEVMECLKNHQLR